MLGSMEEEGLEEPPEGPVGRSTSVAFAAMSHLFSIGPSSEQTCAFSEMEEAKDSVVLSLIEGLGINQQDWRERQLLFFTHYSSCFSVLVTAWQAMNLVMIPFMCTFAPNIPVGMVVFFTVMDIIALGCHTYCRSNGVYLDGSTCVPSWSLISDRSFIIMEALPMIPVELVVVLITQEPVHIAWRCKVLLALGSHNLLTWRVLSFLKSYTTIRLIRMCQLLLIVSHFATCGHAAIVFNSNVNSIHYWMGFVNYHNMRTLDQYLISFDWSIKVSVGMFRGSSMPISDFQLCYVLGVVIVGVCLYVTVVAQVSHIIHSGSINETKYHEKIDFVKDHLTYLQTPKPLQVEILSYYRHIWKKCDFIISGNVLSELPADLLFRIDKFCAKETIKKLPAFADVASKYPSFAQQMMMYVVPLVILPGGYVYKEGSSDKSIYFTMSGELIAVAKRKDDTDTEDTLWSVTLGDIFGEFEAVRRCSRVCGIRAVTYSNLLCLGPDQLQALSLQFPECQSLMIKSTEQTCKRLTRVFPEVDDSHTTITFESETFNKSMKSETQTDNTDDDEVRHLLEGLHDTIAAGNDTKLAELLKQVTRDDIPDIQSVPSLDPYSIAITHGSESCIEVLCKHGFTPQVDVFGRSMTQVKESIFNIKNVSLPKESNSAVAVARAGFKKKSKSSVLLSLVGNTEGHKKYSGLTKMGSCSHFVRLTFDNQKSVSDLSPNIDLSESVSTIKTITSKGSIENSPPQAECLSLLAPHLLNTSSPGIGGDFVTHISSSFGCCTKLAYDSCRILVLFKVLTSTGAQNKSLDPLRTYKFSRKRILEIWGGKIRCCSLYYLADIVQLALRDISVPAIPQFRREPSQDLM